MPTYAKTLRFEQDLDRLSRDERRRFREVTDRFVEDLRRGEGFRPGLRVRGVQGADGVFEMTWAPNGRATFEYGPPRRPGHAHIVWRRVGTHAVLVDP
jgi:hypothetical protein